MTSFLPPLSTATAPHNEIICPELRISGAYWPRTQNLRGWPAQKIPAAELIPHQNRSCFLRQNPPNFVWATVPNPLPIFHTLFDLYSTRCRGLIFNLTMASSKKMCCCLFRDADVPVSERQYKKASCGCCDKADRRASPEGMPLSMITEKSKRRQSDV